MNWLRVLGWLALVAPTSALSCAGDDEAEVFGEHDIEGTVVDEFTKRGISGAKVTFVSDTLDRAETTSEQAGRFVLRVEVPDGVRFGTLGVSKAGYSDGSKVSVYFDGAPLRTELTMRPKN